MTVNNLVSALGLGILLGVAWLLSRQRRVVNGRVVLGGMGLQLALGLFIFRVPAGTGLFLWINDAVVRVLDSAAEGARFVFGPLALAPGQTDAAGTTSLGFILAFQALPTIIFFASLIAVLYHLGIMARVVRGFAWLFSRVLGTSGAESLVAASNIFVGVEATVTVRPYLAGMTRSELCTVLTAGMATVASNVLALYVYTLQAHFPRIAGHLVSASLLSAPAALVFAKLLWPETGSPETGGRNVPPHVERASSFLDAVVTGANTGVRMIAGIAALLIAVIGLVALADLLLGTLGGPVNHLLHLEGTWSLRGLCGYLAWPVVRLLGIPAAEALTAARIVGERLVLTEVVAYQDLARALADGTIHDPRSVVIITYALCGFAHLASMAIFVGGACALAPSRQRDLTAVAWRALLGATLACLSTACIAGLFCTDSTILLGAQP